MMKRQMKELDKKVQADRFINCLNLTSDPESSVKVNLKTLKTSK